MLNRSAVRLKTLRPSCAVTPEEKEEEEEEEASSDLIPTSLVRFEMCIVSNNASLNWSFPHFTIFADSRRFLVARGAEAWETDGLAL